MSRRLPVNFRARKSGPGDGAVEGTSRRFGRSERRRADARGHGPSLALKDEKEGER